MKKREKPFRPLELHQAPDCKANKFHRDPSIQEEDEWEWAAIRVDVEACEKQFDENEPKVEVEATKGLEGKHELMWQMKEPSCERQQREMIKKMKKMKKRMKSWKDC